MTKQEVQKRVLQNGKPLDLNKFKWDENTKTFYSNEINLVLDFGDVNNVSFKTSGYCNFNTGSDCNFETGSDCNFNTGSRCNFYTGSYCNFNTYDNCNFITLDNCSFNTGSYCKFNIGDKCILRTSNSCCVKCYVKIGCDCLVVRRDIYEVIELKANNKIKLNDFMVRGYTIENDK
jgi:hypothetical protein